ncbi:hypothetical protein [Vreelandella alkaliphila]|uniref:Uncharacterized protein n=1 Tax=Vreelandella alkaliphila TaxID=272774 RepID=A0AAJ2VSP4_9GAMM|nr:hypothetical protein [Halomonas alkaliphila]MDX5979635.1 hypothetical protein [Halomonas alkaliphila]
MSRFPRMHGMTLAAGGFIENLRAERLTADPTDLSAGRIWYNETEKALKFTSLDSSGGIVLHAIADEAQLAALAGRLSSVEQTYASTEFVEAKIAALGDALEYVGSVTPGVDEANALDLAALGNTSTGAYYKADQKGYVRVGAGDPFFVNRKDGLLFNGAGGVDVQDNTNSEVDGTDDYVLVTGSTDTGFTVDLAPALKARIADLEAGLANVAGRVEALEQGASSVLSAINAQRFVYQSSAAAVEHLVDHDLNSLFVAVDVWTEGGDGKYRKDIVDIEETNASRVTVRLTESAKIKVVVQVMEAV